jgi:hypothetical protein
MVVQFKFEVDTDMPDVGWKARLAAIWHLRCPRCLKGPVFPRGWRQLSMYYACPACGVVFGRENGYFTGAMIVSYILAVPLLALLTLVTQLVTGLRFDLVLLISIVYFLPFVPALFRYSRVVWMHFDRVVDPTLESEQYVELQPRLGQPELRQHELADAHPGADPAGVPDQAR